MGITVLRHISHTVDYEGKDGGVVYFSCSALKIKRKSITNDDGSQVKDDHSGEFESCLTMNQVIDPTSSVSDWQRTSRTLETSLSITSRSSYYPGPALWSFQNQKGLGV